jgi:hypothetical protein
MHLPHDLVWPLAGTGQQAWSWSMQTRRPWNGVRQMAQAFPWSASIWLYSASVMPYLNQ